MRYYLLVLRLESKPKFIPIFGRFVRNGYVVLATYGRVAFVFRANREIESYGISMETRSKTAAKQRL